MQKLHHMVIMSHTYTSCFRVHDLVSVTRVTKVKVLAKPVNPELAAETVPPVSTELAA